MDQEGLEPLDSLPLCQQQPVILPNGLETERQSLHNLARETASIDYPPHRPRRQRRVGFDHDVRGAGVCQLVVSPASTRLVPG